MSSTTTETATGSSSNGHITLNNTVPAPSLDAYDEEQVRLMEERCILVNEKDEAYGEGSKKECEYSSSSSV
jgi:isopentenyl-diphosphate delta-isomerase